MSVGLTFLGGLGEIGRNCAVLEIDGRIALIDCGLMFPEEDHFGVDLVLPDFSSVIERAGDVDCVILTHGHEDHIGSLSYFLSDINVPVYGTQLAVELARPRIEEAGLEPDLRAVEVAEWVTHGVFRFQLIPVSHSIPQGAGIALDTPEGMIVHSGDFKLDPTPIDGVPTDLPQFAALGSEGVRLLLADSTNAEMPGFVASESSLSQPLYEIVVETRGRLIAACFASHLHRVQQIVDAAVDAGRKIAFLGRSMLRNTEIATRLDLLRVESDRVIRIEDVPDHDPSEVAIICTGAQGEPFAALSLMAAGDHRWVTLEEDDTVLISAKPIPGNETKVSRVINGLLRRGARVFHGNNAAVHVSGHGAEDELKTFMNVVRPQAFVPVHGEYRHLRAHAALAEHMGIPEVFLCEDGDRLTLENGEITYEHRAVPAGHVYVDGLEVGSTPKGIIRDRRHLADDGVIVVTVAVDGRTGEIVQGPDLDSHGFMDDPNELFSKAADSVREEIARFTEWPPDLETLRRHIKGAVNRVTRAETARRAVVVPVVLEI